MEFGISNQQLAGKLAAPLAGPQYGGDCALKEDGLGSSLQRLNDITMQLNQATWELRDCFGISVPETNAKGESMSGLKAAVDRAVCASRASLDNVQLILDHLRS